MKRQVQGHPGGGTSPKQMTSSSSWPSALLTRPWHPASCQEPQGTFFMSTLVTSS